MKNVQLKGIRKTYGEKIVLKDLTMTFDPEHVHVLRGASGSGKTTLLRILEGLQRPDSGSIVGLESEKISVLFQEDRLVENLSVASNLTMVLSRKDTEVLSMIEEDLQELGMKDCARQIVRTLSGGMKRKVALLRALYAESSVLFLDEPLSGLDEISRDQVVEMIAKRRKGRMVFWVSHLDQDLSSLGAKKEYQLCNGALVQQVD